MRRQARIKWIVLAILLASMLGIFSYCLPHLGIDRVSDGWYLSVPYKMMQTHNVNIYQGDPYIENGPHAILASTAIVYYSHSLKLMRYYHFLYSLAVVGIFYLLFFRKFNESQMRPWEIPLIALLFLSSWVTIPLIFIYPIQVNGMTPGLICFIAGLWLEERHPRWAMIAFGFAYSCKGQFLAMLPGILLYKVLYENLDRTLVQRFKEVVLSLFLFFAPTTVFLTAIFAALGLFHQRQDLVAYALRAPSILASELSYIIPVLMHKTISDPRAAEGRLIEYARWGPLTWLLAVGSMSFCLLYTIRAYWVRRQPPPGALHVPAAVLAVAGIGYWINYFFFWRYPFYYNTLPMHWFTILIIPVILYSLKIIFAKRLSARLATVFLLASGVVAGANLVHRVILKPTFNASKPGDSLEPYPWMDSVH